MTIPYTHRCVMRATIQFTTPFLVGAGREGDMADVVFVADANGLPAIPGSSIAGVLRAAFASAHPEAEVNNLFGYQGRREKGDGGKPPGGEGSRIAVSWGCIHDSKDVPVEGIISEDRLADPVLKSAMNPTIRDHVRITHKGVAEASGLAYCEV